LESVQQTWLERLRCVEVLVEGFDLAK